MTFWIRRALLGSLSWVMLCGAGPPGLGLSLQADVAIFGASKAPGFSVGQGLTAGASLGAGLYINPMFTVQVHAATWGGGEATEDERGKPNDGEFVDAGSLGMRLRLQPLDNIQLAAGLGRGTLRWRAVLDGPERKQVGLAWHLGVYFVSQLNFVIEKLPVRAGVGLLYSKMTTADHALGTAAFAVTMQVY